MRDAIRLSLLITFPSLILSLLISLAIVVSCPTGARSVAKTDRLPGLGWDAPYLTPKHELDALGKSMNTYGALADLLRIDLKTMKSRLRGRLAGNPRDSIAYILLGDIHIEEGLLEAAVELFIKANSIAPKFPVIHLALGRAYHKLRDFGAAIAQYDTALALQKNNRRALALRAVSRSMIDDWSGAIADFETANEIAEMSRQVRYRYALCLWADGQVGRAVEHFERSIRGHWTDYRIYVSWSMAEASRGNTDQARKGLRRALEIAPPDRVVLEALADVFTIENKPDSAAHFLERAVRMAPAVTNLRNRLGMLYARLGQREKCEETFEVSTLLESENAESYALWARARSMFGDHEGALEMITKALRLAPFDETIMKLRKEILPTVPLIPKNKR